MGRSKNKEMSFLDHLEELRWHIIRGVLAILVFAIVAFIFHRFIFDEVILYPKNSDFPTNRFMAFFADLLNSPSLKINDKPFNIININMAGQFSTHIMVSLIAGVILAFPYLFWEIWRFVSPALYDNEKRYTRGAIFFTSLLFFLGILFGYYLIVPLSVHFLGSYEVSSQVVNQINLMSYINTVTSVTLASGIVFELPMVVFFLSKIGVATPQSLRKYRRHSIVAVVALAAIITPPDVFSQVLVSLPLILLYEVSIGISARVLARKEKKAVM